MYLSREDEIGPLVPLAVGLLTFASSLLIALVGTLAACLAETARIRAQAASPARPLTPGEERPATGRTRGGWSRVNLSPCRVTQQAIADPPSRQRDDPTAQLT